MVQNITHRIQYSVVQYRTSRIYGDIQAYICVCIYIYIYIYIYVRTRTKQKASVSILLKTICPLFNYGKTFIPIGLYNIHKNTCFIVIEKYTHKTAAAHLQQKKCSMMHELNLEEHACCYSHMKLSPMELFHQHEKTS